MNILNINQPGGFPMTTRILDELQKAYTLFNSLGAISGDKTIISGCVTTGTNVSDGYVYVNGEVFNFVGGTLQTEVKIVEVTEALVFENNVSKTVIKTRYVTFGTGIDTIPWADFTRGLETKEIQALFNGITTSLTTINNKLATIATGADVSLQPDFNQLDNTKKDYIKNKPVGAFLYKGTYVIGDVAAGGGTKRTVTFPNVGTNNYMIVGELTSNSANWDVDNEVGWMSKDKTNTSFELLLAEFAPATQNLSFIFMLIPM